MISAVESRECPVEEVGVKIERVPSVECVALLNVNLATECSACYSGAVIDNHLPSSRGEGVFNVSY